MSIMLNIDTASEQAHVSFAIDGEPVHVLTSGSQKEHASFLQTAIQELVTITGIPLAKLDAVALTAGPGSYTGLRVGMSSAKGLCYALNKPLITMGTLEVLTVSALDLFPATDTNLRYCPMLDARRMEVFTAIYQHDLTAQLAPCAMILDGSSFEKELAAHTIMFFGNGAGKWQTVCKHPNAVFENVPVSPKSMSKHSNFLFSKKIFAELAYSEPFYLKEFQTVSNNPA